MTIEREHLRPLAGEGFDLATVTFPQVNDSGTIAVLTNFYSVPLPPGTRVEAKTQAAYIEIWHKGQCMARHERCFQRRQKYSTWSIIWMRCERSPERWRGQCRWSSGARRDGGRQVLIDSGKN